MTDFDARVYAVFENVFDVPADELSGDMTSDDVDGWDSLSHVTLILMLSREFSIEIAPTETEDLENIGELVAFIGEKVKR